MRRSASSPASSLWIPCFFKTRWWVVCRWTLPNGRTEQRSSVLYVSSDTPCNVFRNPWMRCGGSSLDSVLSSGRDSSGPSRWLQRTAGQSWKRRQNHRLLAPTSCPRRHYIYEWPVWPRGFCRCTAYFNCIKSSSCYVLAASSEIEVAPEDALQGYRFLFRAEEVWFLSQRKQQFSNWFTKLQLGFSTT